MNFSLFQMGILSVNNEWKDVHMTFTTTTLHHGMVAIVDDAWGQLFDVTSVTLDCVEKMPT